MNRIISLVSLVLLIGGLGYAYYTGLLMQTLNPEVQVITAKQDLLEDQRIRPANLRISNMSINDVEAGMMVFPQGMSLKEIASDLNGTVAAHRIKKGSVLKADDVHKVKGAYVMRVIRKIEKGETLERSNILVTLDLGDIPDGAIVFSSEQGALEKYIETEQLNASRELVEGSIVMVDDVSGGDGSVYVLAADGTFERGDFLSLQDVQIVQRLSRDIPRGTVSFPSRDAAEIFVSTSGGISISRGLEDGEVLVVSSIARTGGSALSDGQIPTTLEELLEYQVKFPNKTIFVDDKILVGSEPSEGGLVDLWVETESTEGPYGVVKLKKIFDDAITFRVTRELQTEEGQRVDFYHWAEIGEKAFSAIEDARREARVAFMVNDSTSITDFLGNGSVCRDEVCSVSRTVSDDMRRVRLAFTDEGELAESAEEDTNDPLRILDGVDVEMERRMVAAGYRTFRDIASWEDAALKVIAFNLEIPSQNLAVYIRQQARNIVDNPERTRRDLGLTDRSMGE